MKKNMNKRVFIKSGNDTRSISINFFILGIRFTDLKGRRTLKTLIDLSCGRFEIPILEIIKSKRLTTTIKKSKIFQKSRK